MGFARFIKSALAASDNESERRLLQTDPTYRTYYESKGYVETAADNHERDVYRLSRPLGPLRKDGRSHKLLLHQGIYVDPYLWEFTDGGKREDGSRKLSIKQTPDPDLGQWLGQKPENAGTTTFRDSEIYNTTRTVKHYHGKQYNLLGMKGGTQCQEAADDVQSIVTGGRSTLPKAPVSRMPGIVLKKLVSEQMEENIMHAKGVSGTYSRHWANLDSDAMVEDAMGNMAKAGRRHNWL